MIQSNLFSKKNLVLAAIAAIIIAGGLWYWRGQAKPLPAAVSLPVPFTVQAPDDHWLNNENCEEASAIMVDAFLSGNHDDKLAPAEAQKQINDLIAWEQANFGFNANTGAGETSRMIESVFQLRTKQIDNFTEQDLKAELAQQHPVLLFIDARQLRDTYYDQLGPTYHVFVIRGYNQQGFIVNDPGRESGKDDIYSFAVLQNAAADWNSSTKALAPDHKVALAVFK